MLSQNKTQGTDDVFREALPWGQIKSLINEIYNQWIHGCV